MPDLEGVLVVSLEQAVAAPYASSRLADAGARVIKVERPEGDFARRYDNLVNGQSAYFVWLNRGKESLCLNLKDGKDLSILHAVVAEADVFIQNLAPDVATRLGMGAAELSERYPRLIYCSISGYGEEGPYRAQKAYDMLIQGESGLLAINGTAEGAARVGISVCDIAAGMTAFSAILQALIARSQTDKGRILDVSLFHSIADWMNVPYLQSRYGGRPPQRMGLRHPSIVPYGAFTCADGKVILLSIQNEREWASFCADFLGDRALETDPRFASNIDRVTNRAPLETIVTAAMARLPREVAVARLTEAGVACGRQLDLEELIGHPQRRMIAIETDAGEIELLAPGARVVGEPLQQYGRVPALGEHTETIRQELRTRHGK
jgi:crotonobetainyl-CoA:carnitine CoA-transferase CaiB-like acyl-CoA transferase